jgi:AcrR family transcriptional regulator
MVQDDPMRDDPRVARSKASILEAAAELISEAGFPGVSIEAVAARSGAAKTTIYRHWPSRDALMVEAFARCTGPPEGSPDTGSLRGDLRQILGALARFLREEGSCASLQSLTDVARRDPELAQLHAAFIAERRRPLVEALERAVARGELPAGVDVGDAVSVVVGPLFYRAMISFEPIDEAFVETAVRRAIGALEADG